MIGKLFGAATARRQAERRANEYRDLIRKEAIIGGQMFGPVPKGGRREFFCLDPQTWVWHEEWTDVKGNYRTITTRYDVRAHGVFKAQDGHPYQPISGEEAKHFFTATKLYNKRVKTEIYRLSV